MEGDLHAKMEGVNIKVQYISEGVHDIQNRVHGIKDRVYDIQVEVRHIKHEQRFHGDVFNNMEKWLACLHARGHPSRNAAKEEEN